MQTEVYHVRCFCEFADLCRPQHFTRLHPYTRNTWFRCHSSVFDVPSLHLVDAGAERLLQE
jgi:hypothetical protein